MWSVFGRKLYFGFFGIDLGSFVAKVFVAARWSFFSATAKSLATSSCGYLELKSFFLIKKCAAAAKHLVRCLKAMLENFGWNGHGSIQLQQFSSVISSRVSLSFFKFEFCWC